MIQEILGYLLIRSFLLNNTEKEIIDTVEDEETFAYILDSIYNLMQQEDFVFTSPALYSRVEEFISHYRFDYIKNKAYNEKMNYIIGRLRDFTLMSDNRKNYIQKNWIKEESEARGLLKRYQTIEDLYFLISLDATYISGIITFDEPFEINNPIEYLSIINIIMNKYPDYFNEDAVLLEVIRKTLLSMKECNFVRIRDSKMLTKTLNKLNENYKVSEDVEFEFGYTKKKIKK